MTKVSIIIPMYNEQSYIARCLESLKKQTYKDFEIILIDDGSQDDTVKIAEGYHKDFNLTILQQKNSGPGKARNRGAKEAKGDILVFVDADMMFDTKYVEELVKPIIKGKEVGTAHGREYVANLENKIARGFGYIRVKYNPKNQRSGVYRAIDKSVFLKAGGFDTSKGYGDDNLSKLGGSLFVPTAIAYHNNPESIKEIFFHSIRVGASLRKTGEIKGYLKTYIIWVIAFLILFLISSYILILKKIFIVLPLALIGLLILFVLLKTIQRTIKEKYLSNLIFIPIVMITRGVGYITGAIKYTLKKRIY